MRKSVTTKIKYKRDEGYGDTQTRTLTLTNWPRNKKMFIDPSKNAIIADINGYAEISEINGHSLANLSIDELVEISQEHFGTELDCWTYTFKPEKHLQTVPKRILKYLKHQWSVRFGKAIIKHQTDPHMPGSVAKEIKITRKEMLKWPQTKSTLF